MNKCNLVAYRERKWIKSLLSLPALQIREFYLMIVPTQCGGKEIIMSTLRDAKIGHTVKVAGLQGSGAVKRRIMDMGITKGTEIYVRKEAPLGDPIEITVRGYELSIRKADAEMILIN